MPGTLPISDSTIYSERCVCRSLGLNQSALDAARRRGELRSKRAGNTRVYLGRWIREWVERSGEPQTEAAAC